MREPRGGFHTAQHDGGPDARGCSLAGLLSGPRAVRRAGKPLSTPLNVAHAQQDVAQPTCLCRGGSELCPLGLPSAQKKAQARENPALWGHGSGATGVCPGKVYLMHSSDKGAWTELQEQELDVPNSSPGVRVPADRCGKAGRCHT